MMMDRVSDSTLLSIIARTLPEGETYLAEPKIALPKIAKDRALTQSIEHAVKSVPTCHRLQMRDSRMMADISDNSVHLVLTSPPYWTLKQYRDGEGQLGHVENYERFLEELDKVWKHCKRILVEGGRLIIVVGDVCLSRRKNDRHAVVPLHASIQERCRAIGFDNLAPIIWYKIANAVFEVENGTGFLGKPYEPNAIIKNDIEYILMQRKPSAYRSPSTATRILSVISEENHRNWFKQIWDLKGDSTRHHPAPYPLELAERLVRMFSFVGDTVVDPFMGTGTTNVAASLWGRNSIGFEIDPVYFEHASKRLKAKHSEFFSTATVEAIG